VLKVALGPGFAANQGGPYIADTERSDSASPLPQDPFKALAEHRAELQALLSVLDNAPFVAPLKDYYISSRYGPRRDPFHGRRAVHRGADMAAWSGTPVMAGANGTVVHAGRKGAYGNMVQIDHGNGFVTRYGHLKRVKVKLGQVVSAGDVVGL